jgi:nucleoid-associated protein YgaU
MLEKLSIKPLPPSKLEAITALFNPNAYSITKTLSWSQNSSSDRKKNAPTLTFGGGASRQLNLELFFDVTEPVNDQEIEDVRELTNEVVALTRIERDLGRPPACEISWGAAPAGSDFPFTGVVTSLTQKFVLFRADGKPVRATLTLAFMEFLDPEKDQRETDPEFTTRVVRRGDTLSSIAAEVYRDPSLWRLIAEANAIDDPRRIPAGLRLNIPKLV